MAVTFIESFNWMDVGMTGPQIDTALARKTISRSVLTFTDANTVSGIGGNGTALSLREPTQFVRWPLSKTSTATDEIGCGLWFRQTLVEHETQELFGLVDVSGDRFVVNIRFNGTTGYLEVRRSTSLLVALDVSPPINQWHFIEYKTVVNDSTGSWEVRLNGVTIGSATGVDTREAGTGTVDAIQIGGLASGSGSCDFAGIICWDDQGGTLTDFPGPKTFKTLFPDADGDDEQWATSSGADSFSLVNETAPHDDDSSYIEDTVSNNRTLFTYDNLSTNYTDVVGIQANSVVRETDASDFTLINTFKSGGTLYPESAQAIAGQTFESLFNVLDQDPDISASWTIANLNALQVGVEVG